MDATIQVRGLRKRFGPVLALDGMSFTAAAWQPSRSARHHLLWLAHSQGLTAGRVDEVIEQSGLQAAIWRKAGGRALKSTHLQRPTDNVGPSI